MSDIYRLPPRPPSSTPGRHRASGRKCSAGFGVKYESSRRDPEDYFNPNRERRLIVSYWSSWQRISIFEPFNPWRLLGLHSSQAPFGEVKAAFKRSITQSIPQQRVLVSLGYHIITSSGERYKRVHGTDEYVVRRRDHFFLAACGHVEELSRVISGKQYLVEDKDEYGRTLLYTASKSGFYEVCKLLLQKGASVDEPQRDGSTPLHAAAYFGHERVIELLLQYGARTDIVNNWGNTALLESASGRITGLIQSASVDQISSLAAELRTKMIVLNVRVIEHKGKVIAKELIRNASVLDARTRARWNQIHRCWEIVWHGTQYRNLQSILERGLLPAGSRGITPVKGHIELGAKVFGVQNWAAAIFVSPSILYASYESYSQRVFSEGQLWCVLVKAYCRPGSMKSYDPTVLKYERKDDEPEKPEYRVPVDEENKNVISRVESARNVVVHSVMFVRVSFLKEQDLNFTEALTLLH